MSKLSKVFWVLFAITFPLLMSCKKDSTDQVETPVQPGQMVAKINGNNWSTDQVNAQTLQGLFNVTGVADDGSAITFTLGNFASGVFNSSAADQNVMSYVPNDSGNTTSYTSIAPGGDGFVDITAINETDSLVSGTFEFKAINPATGDTIYITEGQFQDIPYLTETVVIVDNNLEVKINDNNWVAQSVVGIVSQGKLRIIGTDASASQTVGLYIPTDVAAGTFQLGNPFSDDYGAQYNVDSQTFLMSDSGTLTIVLHDKVNKVIVGTFEFAASQMGGSMTAELTEGKFSLTY